MRIAQILGLTTGQIDDERPRLAGDDRLAPRPRTVVESRHDAEIAGAPQTPLHRLMRHADRAPRRVERGRLAIHQQNTSPLDPARRFRPRARNPFEISQLLFRKPQFDHTPRRGHFPSPSSANSPNGYMVAALCQWNPGHTSGIKESIV